jgi:PleD family two-component response regulator
VSCFTDGAPMADEIMAQADKKLYESKHKGKNSVSH